MPPFPPRPGELEARAVRDQIGLRDEQPIADIVTFIESRAQVPVFLTPLPGRIAGLAQRHNGRWYIVGDSGGDGQAWNLPGRLRFTLAHELGHVVMGHRPAVDDEATLKFTGPTGDPQEADANRFAAELLVPRGMAEEAFYRDERANVVDLSFTLAARTGTTAWVPLYRLFTLGLVPYARRDEVKEELRNDPRLRTATAIGDCVDRYAGTDETRKPDRQFPSDPAA